MNTPLCAATAVLAMIGAVALPPSAAAAAEPTVDGFSFPVGDGSVRPARGDGDGWYVAQDFGGRSGYHGGEDWNSDGGGSSDYGAPVLAAAAGTVTYAGNPGGRWGNVVLIRHRLPDGREVATQYAHLASITRSTGTVRRGETIGTIGTAGGLYGAHLHFELRTDPRLAADASPRATSGQGFTDPSDFIDAHRRLTADPDAPALAVTRRGEVWLAAVRRDGSLFTRVWSPASGWSEFVRQGAPGGWSTAAGPALVATGNRVLLAAVSKTGSLHTRSLAARRNGTWRRHGGREYSTDAAPAIATTATGGVVIAAVLRTGALVTRRLNPRLGWAPLSNEPGSWSTGSSPALVTSGHATLLFGVARSGTLSWRRLDGGGSAPVTRRVWSTDSGPSAAKTADGVVVAGVDAAGRLLSTKLLANGTWSRLQRHGRTMKWSLQASPVFIGGRGHAHLYAITAHGSLFGRALDVTRLKRLGRPQAWSGRVGVAGLRSSDGPPMLASVARDGSLITAMSRPEDTSPYTAVHGSAWGR